MGGDVPESQEVERGFGGWGEQIFGKNTPLRKFENYKEKERLMGNRVAVCSVALQICNLC